MSYNLVYNAIANSVLGIPIGNCFKLQFVLLLLCVCMYIGHRSGLLQLQLGSCRLLGSCVCVNS